MIFFLYTKQPTRFLRPQTFSPQFIRYWVLLHNYKKGWWGGMCPPSPKYFFLFHMILIVILYWTQTRLYARRLIVRIIIIGVVYHSKKKMTSNNPVAHFTRSPVLSSAVRPHVSIDCGKKQKKQLVGYNDNGL